MGSVTGEAQKNRTVPHRRVPFKAAMQLQKGTNSNNNNNKIEYKCKK